MKHFEKFFSNPPYQTFKSFGDLRLQAPYRLSSPILQVALTTFAEANGLSATSDHRLVKLPEVAIPPGAPQKLLWLGFSTGQAKHCLILTDPSRVPIKMITPFGKKLEYCVVV